MFQVFLSNKREFKQEPLVERPHTLSTCRSISVTIVHNIFRSQKKKRETTMTSLIPLYEHYIFNHVC